MRSAWLATVATLAFLAVLVLSPIATQAKPPGWGFDPVVSVPGKVSPSKLAAYDVTIRNTGRSNISSVLMTTDIDADDPLAIPAYISDATWVGQPDPLIIRPCGNPPYTAALSCDFGSLVAGARVSLRLAFPVPATAGTYSFNFTLTGNGNTPSDTGGTSHGDTKKGLATVNVSADPDFAGGFVLDSDTFSTLESLTRQNPQAATLTTTQDLQPATVEEGNTFSGAGDLCSTVNCIGQWTTISAPNSGVEDPISGSLLIYGKGIPGSVGPEDIVLYHLGGTELERGDDGIIGDEAEEICDSASDSASAPCIFVTEVGQNFRIDFWLVHNGTLRGTW
jgi:hypothetical protein